MYCTKCGNKLIDNAKFCSSCGSSTGNQQINQQLPEPRKNTGCLIATVTGVIIFLVATAILIFSGIMLLIREIAHNEPEISCCLKAEGNYKNGTCKNYNKDVYNKCINNEKDIEKPSY